MLKLSSELIESYSIKILLQPLSPIKDETYKNLLSNLEN